MEGFLVIDKPSSWTSFDVVNKVRSLLAKASNQSPKKIKVGHSGTLDPFATGLLIVLVGKSYTKQASTLLKKDKTYEVTMELGSVSLTGDLEGQISTINSSKKPSKSEIEQTLKLFKGEINQTPPQYSAVKVNGKRAYDLARAGQVVSLAERAIIIKELSLVSYAYPTVQLIAAVSSGTYIRSLVEDIGKQLGTGGYTKQLRRVNIGKCLIDQAEPINELNEQNILSKLKQELIV